MVEVSEWKRAGASPDTGMLRYSRSPEAPGSGEGQNMEYEVGAVAKRFACAAEIPIVHHPDEVLEQGRTKVKADTIMATWSRVNDGAWDVIAVTVIGDRVYRGEVQANDRRIFKWDKMEFVPRWVMNLIKANRPDSK